MSSEEGGGNEPATAGSNDNDQFPKKTDANLQSPSVDKAGVESANSKDQTGSVDNAALADAKLNDAQAPRDKGKATKGNDKDQTKGDGQKRSDELELKYGARHVVLLFKPVAICMLFAIFMTKVVEELQPSGRVDTAHPVFFKEGSGQDTGSKYGNTAVNAGIIIGAIIVMSFVLLACVIYCFKCLMIYLVCAMTMINILAQGMLIKSVIGALNIPFDYIAAFIILYNFSVTTIAAIFWKGPRIIEQVFLVINCATLSCLLNRIIPGAAVFLVLGLLVLWDLFAVLAPIGPLRLLINHMKESDKELGQGLVYTAGIMGFEPGTVTKPKPKRAKAGAEADGVQDQLNKDKVELAPVTAENQHAAGSDGAAEIAAPAPTNDTGFDKPAAAIPDGDKKTEAAPEKQTEADEEEEYEEGNIKLGLGDFIFYSLLISRAAIQASMTIVIACFICVLVGLASTLIILAIYKKALPAIPISIVLALIFYYLGEMAMGPFLNDLAFSQIII